MHLGSLCTYRDWTKHVSIVWIKPKLKPQTSTRTGNQAGRHEKAFDQEWGPKQTVFLFSLIHSEKTTYFVQFMSTFIHIKFEQVGSQQELILIHSIPCRAYLNVNPHVCMLCGHVTCLTAFLFCITFLKIDEKPKIWKPSTLSPQYVRNTKHFTQTGTLKQFSSSCFT